MSDHLQIDINDRELIATLSRAVDRLEHPTELMQAIGATLESNIELRLENTKTDPAGNRWLPLAPATLKRKAGRGSLLVLSGLMKEIHRNVEERAVEVGSAEFYLGFHETGTQRMPRRQVLSDDPVAGTLGQQDRRDVLDAVAKYLADAGL